jgi:hypothetical protein
MYLFGFGIACIPNPKGGSLRDPGGCNIMTLREIAKRIKAQSITDRVRELMSDTGVQEYSIYSPPTARWQEILSGLGLKDLKNTVCVTCYGTNSEVFEAIEKQLKKRYKAVVAVTVDELGFRKVFAAGNNPDKEPELTLCVNWYEGSREETKAMYGSSTDAANNTDTADSTDADLEIELEDTSDPFA